MSEFEELSHNIIFSAHPPAVPITPLADADKIQVWTAIFGDKSPRAVYGVLSAGLQNVKMFLPVIPPVEGNSVILRLELWNKNSKAETAITFPGPLNAASEIFIANLNVTSGPKGAGTGAKVRCNLVNLAEAMFPGIQKISASFTKMGGYAGARFFNTPSAHVWSTLREELGRNRAIRARLPEEVLEKLDTILANDDPRAIWELAGLDTVLEFSTPKESIPLGKFLLIGKTWVGSFDMKDKSRIEGLRKYAAKERVAHDTIQAQGARRI